MSAAIGVIRVAFDLDESAFLHITYDAADRAAQLAHAGHLLHALVLARIRPIAPSQRSGQPADARQRTKLAKFIRNSFDSIPSIEVDDSRRRTIVCLFLLAAIRRAERRKQAGGSGRCAELEKRLLLL